MLNESIERCSDAPCTVQTVKTMHLYCAEHSLLIPCMRNLLGAHDLFLAHDFDRIEAQIVF